MSQVKVDKGTPEKILDMGIESWGQWGCDISTFDWEYDFTETAYFYEGEVEVTCENGEKVRFGAGDIVTFPKGLKCTWDVTVPVRKRYKFD